MPLKVSLLLAFVLVISTRAASHKRAAPAIPKQTIRSSRLGDVAQAGIGSRRRGYGHDVHQPRPYVRRVEVPEDDLKLGPALKKSRATTATSTASSSTTVPTAALTVTPTSVPAALPVTHAPVATLRRASDYYFFEEKIGKGSFGDVFLVKSKYNDATATHKYALKTLEWASDARDLLMLLREARVARFVSQHLASPSLMPTFDLFVEERDPRVAYGMRTHMVMPLYHLTLDKWIMRQSEYSSQVLHYDTVRSLFAQLLLAVRDLHAVGIVHRDITPTNVLLYNDSHEGRTYAALSDFGTARFVGSSNSKPECENNCSEMCPCSKDEIPDFTDWFTARFWRPPEVTLRTAFTPSNKFDIWSLGAVFAEILQLAHHMEEGPLMPDLSETLFGAQHPRAQQAGKFTRAPYRGYGVFAGTTCLLTLRRVIHRLNIQKDEVCSYAESFAQQYGECDPVSVLRSSCEFVSTTSEQPPDTMFPSAAHWRGLVEVTQSMLQFTPSKRPSASELLSHPVFSDLQPPERDFKRLRQLSAQMLSFDRDKMKTADILQMLREEANQYPLESTPASTETPQTEDTFSV